jgi:hypothetical protein
MQSLELVLAASGLYFPVEQEEHWVEDVNPVDKPYFPASQAVQFERSVYPVSVPYRPVGQVVHKLVDVSPKWGP